MTMANEPKVSRAQKAATDILLNELGAILPLTGEHYARLDHMARIIEAAYSDKSAMRHAEVFRAIEKELKRWAKHCKDNSILPIETILGEDNSLQHALTDVALAACSQPVAPGPDMLMEAIGEVLLAFETGVFVRSTCFDHRSDWALKIVKPLQALATLKTHHEKKAAPPQVSTPRPTPEELSVSFDLLFGKYRVLLRGNADPLVLLDYEDEIRRRAGENK